MGTRGVEASNQWWHAKSIAQQRQFQDDAEALLANWGRLHRDGPEAQRHAAAHVQWFAQIPGTPTHEHDPASASAMVRGISTLYVTNADFHPAFGGVEAAEFAAHALRVYVDSV